MNFEQIKREIDFLLMALEMEYKKKQPISHYLLEKIEAIEMKVRILKSHVD